MQVNLKQKGALRQLVFLIRNLRNLNIDISVFGDIDSRSLAARVSTILDECVDPDGDLHCQINRAFKSEAGLEMLQRSPQAGSLKMRGAYVQQKSPAKVQEQIHVPEPETSAH